jgi:CRP-like cAMP-binding protein
MMDRTGEFGSHSVPQNELLQRRLERFADLSVVELALLESLPAKTEEFFGGTELVAEGQCLDAPHLLLSGWACRFRMLPDGRRQIFEFTLPGDIYGLCLRPQAIALTTTISLTPVRIADASALGEALLRRPEEHPGLTAALHSTASLEEAYLLNQLMRVGRQTAYERTAHLILELHERLSIVGMASETTVPIPLTQEIMADALGLSVVHLNRTLQALRRNQLIEFKSGQMRLLQPEQLRELADFRSPRITQQAKAA